MQTKIRTSIRNGTAAVLRSLLALSPTTAWAVVAYSSLSASEVGGLCLDDGRKVAVGVQVPAGGPDYRINEVTIRLHDTAGGGAPFSLACLRR